MATLGQIIKERRKAKGWTQADLAKRTGGRIPQAHITQIETGQKENVKIETLLTIAEGLGCAATELLPEEFHHPRHSAATFG